MPSGLPEPPASSSEYKHFFDSGVFLTSLRTRTAWRFRRPGTSSRRPRWKWPPGGSQRVFFGVPVGPPGQLLGLLAQKITSRKLPGQAYLRYACFGSPMHPDRTVSGRSTSPTSPFLRAANAPPGPPRPMSRFKWDMGLRGVPVSRFFCTRTCCRACQYGVRRCRASAVTSQT